MLSVLGQCGRPFLVNRLDRLNAVGSSPDRLANAEVDKPWRAARLSIPAQICLCENMNGTLMKQPSHGAEFKPLKGASLQR